MKNNITIQFIFLSLFFTAPLYAQVTIGSQTAPERAALLQIKEYEATPGTGAKTADKGILLPRVKLKSLSDITVITGDSLKAADLTGLLVYNVNPAGMEVGFYAWSGQDWGILEIISEEEGSYTKKALVSASTLTDSNTPTVTLGRFTFRFSPNKEAQIKMNSQPSNTETTGFHICRFWDDPKIPSTPSGYAYDVGKIVFTTDKYSEWKNFHSVAMAEERWEVWLADSYINKIYNIQFIIYAKDPLVPIYIVLVTEF
jgi:hypothetical protein